jgi:putative addiction module component (TIGR02574 family)
MILERFPEVQKLSPSEKLAFVSELWNELEAEPNSIPVSAEIVAELDRRMAEFQKNPTHFKTWEEVKQRLLKQANG